MMQLLHLNFAKCFIFIFVFAFASELFAQPAPRARERVSQTKKIKLLETLELDERSAEKVMSKYNEWENTIHSKRHQVNEAISQIEEAISQNASKADINKKVKNYLLRFDEFQKSISERNKDMQTVLNDIEYAKYIVFEERFTQEMQRILFKRFKDRKQRTNPDSND